MGISALLCVNGDLSPSPLVIGSLMTIHNKTKYVLKILNRFASTHKDNPLSPKMNYNINMDSRVSK
jgi:hypothetical protein